MTELWVRSSVWIERLPPEEKAVSSSLAGLISDKPSMMACLRLPPSLAFGPRKSVL